MLAETPMRGADYLSAARQSAINLRSIESELFANGAENPWPTYKSGLNSYNRAFSSVLDRPFEELLPLAKEPSLVFDALSETKFLTDLATVSKGNFLGGMALGLADKPRGDSVEMCTVHNIEQLNGDIFSRTEWIDRVNTYLKTNKRNGFNLIVSRGDGGALVKDEEMVRELKWLMTNTLWQLLDTNGMLFIDYNIARIAPEMDDWKNKLNDMGIETKNEHWLHIQGPFRLIKHENSPKQLPPIPRIK